MKKMRLTLTSLLCLLFVVAILAQNTSKENVVNSTQEEDALSVPCLYNNDGNKITYNIEEERCCEFKKVRTGIKVGLGNSRAVVNREAGNFTKEFSWEGGVYFRYNINRKLYIQPEAIYHHQKYSRTTNLREFTYTHHQVRGQLLGGIKPIGLGLYFNGGVYYSYQIGGKVETNTNGNTTESIFSDFPERNGEVAPFNKTDLGYILGGTFSFGSGGLALSVLFSQSFDSVLNDAYHIGDADFENLNLRHKSIHFAIQKKF